MKRKLDANDAPTVEVLDEAKADDVSFDSFGLDPRLIQAVAKAKFSTPTPVQARVIPLALEGKDVLAKSKTGSGKTAAYVLPILQSILRRKKSSPKDKVTSTLVLVPTRELADQVQKAFASLSSFCTKDLRSLNLTQRLSDAVLQAVLQESPDIIVSTPGRVTQYLNSGRVSLDKVSHLVIDEADIVLSYGYEDDINTIASILPRGVQTFLISATLTPEVEELKIIFCRDAAVIKIDEKEEKGEGVTQYVVRCGEDEKFLLIFVLFKLRLVKGKSIIFVHDVDRSYRLKLFLEQFGIKSCVLNAELPVNSRLHVVQEFNKGLYDILIAADDQEVLGGIVRRSKVQTQDGNAPDHEMSDEDDEDDQHASKKSKLSNNEKDYGVSRGIDFQNVSCVINFDLPQNSKSYTHRIGRTARAGKAGMALSFVVPKDRFGKHKATSIPASKNDERVLEKIIARQEKKGNEVKPYHFDMGQVDAFRYRMNDALRAVTRAAVHEARAREIKQELIKSEKLRKHFEENPDDLRHLRHDGEHGAIVRHQSHLKHVPDYLMPPQGKKGVSTEDIGFVGLRKLGSDSKRKDNKKRGGARKTRASGKTRGKVDPLKSFSARKRR
ncbi:ATP-dependent RNA helicase dbp9 [Capronia coronata CBS 617.96]|uniref:RNA helicase n=1 Tax=Capronia coronata CBS 617.96 TaxID=1182541 RepID=W9YFY3_9EURO|nr:ATP-dependent RNA helicase dbp9 [Capronia coronata CBS 617.96]EXJ91433.1 ATP-dependent RNA helicase dbp9 [Capronia coronata CBS 617.96]